MADVKWIKITTDIFDNRKIRQIEAMPDGDSIIVIWLKLLILAGDVNENGYIFLTQDIPYTDQLLATQFNRPLTTIQLALATFEKFGMIEIVDDVIKVSNWEKYQNVEGMDRIRLGNRLRKQKQREREKEEKDGHVTCHVTSRDGHGSSLYLISNNNSISSSDSKDKDIGITKDKDNPNDKYYVEIIDYLNLKTGSNYRYSTKSIREYINGRLREGYTVDDFKTVIDKKCLEWEGTDQEQYLRPSTLFAPKHFAEYLNQPVKKAKKSGFGFADIDWSTI